MPKNLVLNSPEITENMVFLLETDPHFQKAFNGQMPARTWQQTPCTFESFVDTVVSQQLSLKAAATIFSRVETALGSITPEAIAQTATEELRACGLSFQKIKYLKGLAEAVLENRFNPADLHTMADDAVIKAVTDLHGFGVWSAQMLLIFNLARVDVFPPHDLGVLEGLRKLRRLKTRPKPTEAEGYAARRWKGKRTAASLLLWEANRL